MAWGGCGRARRAVTASRGCGPRAKWLRSGAQVLCVVPLTFRRACFWVVRTPRGTCMVTALAASMKYRTVVVYGTKKASGLPKAKAKVRGSREAAEPTRRGLRDRIYF